MAKLSALLLLLCASFAAAQVFDKVAPDKKAEEAFANIQVLKGDPSTSVRGAMEFFNTALGVKCDACHDTNNAFDKDVKDLKKTAREMITMTREINKIAFRGRPQVNCYTCHQGHNRPTAVPEIPALPAGPAMTRFQQPGPPPGMGRQGQPGTPGQAGQPGQPGQPPRPPLPPAPKAEDVVAKYQAAIGGADKLAKLQSLVVKGSQNTPDGKPATVTVQMQSGKVMSEVRAGDRVITEGWNGKDAWGKATGMPYHSSEETAPLMEREAELYPGSRLLANPAGLRVIAGVKVGNHDTLIVTPGQRTPTQDRLYFDKDSGLLVRLVYAVPTSFGPLPTQIDYDDYRDAGNGIKLPFKVTYSRPTTTVTQTLSSVQVNAKVDDAAFEAPKP